MVRLGRWAIAVLNHPDRRAAWVVEWFEAAAQPHPVRLRFISLGRVSAALVLALMAPRSSLRVLTHGGPGRWLRLRTHLAGVSARGANPPSYHAWCRLFDRPPASLASHSARAQIITVVLNQHPSPTGDDPADTAAAPADLHRPKRLAAATQTEIDVLVAGRDPESIYFLILAPGETLSPEAPPAYRGAIAAESWDLVVGDADSIDAAGTRSRPVFLPEPAPVSVRSGLFAHLPVLVRADRIVPAPDIGADATAWRDAIWQAAFADGRVPRVRRIPLVLSHRPVAATMILARRQPPAVARDNRPRVSVIIPSACRAPHVAECITRIMQSVDGPGIEVLLVVTNRDAADPVQSRIIGRLSRESRLRVIDVAARGFNYAAANNSAAEQASGQLLLLLNDDVAPITPDWLTAMAAHLNDPGVAAVGAKLLYPDETIQHGGVILGLGGICDHADRFLPRHDPGYLGLAVADHEVSAVTGACLLVRASAYREVGGLDEGFAIALNDVDLCLKLRANGHRIIYCAQAELVHYESQSLGRHYAGDRAPLQGIEIGRFRNRWGQAPIEDPYHSPNLSLQPGRERTPAFPPRRRLR